MPNAYSRAAKAHTHDNEGIRLQKLLAQAGFGSRRKCEEIITEEMCIRDRTMEEAAQQAARLAANGKEVR